MKVSVLERFPFQDFTVLIKFFAFILYQGDGAWGQWTEVECQAGVQIRGRQCDNPSPRYGGSVCPGANFEIVARFTDKECKTKTPGNVNESSYITIQQKLLYSTHNCLSKILCAIKRCPLSTSEFQ